MLDDGLSASHQLVSLSWETNKKKDIKALVLWVSAVCSHALSWTGIDLLRNEEEEKSIAFTWMHNKQF